MHLNQCPFCSSELIEIIANVRLEKFDLIEPLIRCMNCRSFYWKKSKQKAVYLSGICETRWEDPEKCRGFIEHYCRSKGTSYSDLVSFEQVDELCSYCPFMKFVISDSSKRWSLC
ncbi:MAG: hypothetical protein JRE23_13245 [Deltaproteobacteria bacterium]|nr:hypothetical protein [Deltaproteobacteria bacterium]